MRRGSADDGGGAPPPLRFGAYIPRAWAFLRRFLVEADALSLVQLFEVSGLHRAAMEEPFLPAIVPDEPESPIAHQTLDDPVRHVDNLRGPRCTVLPILGIKFCSMERGRGWPLAEPPPPCGGRSQLASRGLQSEDVGSNRVGKAFVSGHHDGGESAITTDH